MSAISDSGFRFEIFSSIINVSPLRFDEEVTSFSVNELASCLVSVKVLFEISFDCFL